MKNNHLLQAKIRNIPKIMNLGHSEAQTQIYQQQYLFGNQQLITNSHTITSAPKRYDTSKPLKLKDCDPKDIICITKDRVIQQNIIKVPIVSKPLQKSFKRPLTGKVQRAKDQSKENQQLFNYEKVMKQKNDRKQKFLSDIQRKIIQAQKQANFLERQFRQQQQELKQIQDLQQKINSKFHNQLVIEQVSKIQQQIENKQKQQKVKKIQLGMQINQIKKVISGEQQFNQQVVDEADDLINRIRGKKLQKQTLHQQTKQKVARPASKRISSTVSSFNTTKKQT